MARYHFNNGPWWYVLRKRSISDLRFVSGRYGEDGMFTMELLMRIGRIAHVDTQCYCYLVRPNSTTTRRSREHMLKVMGDYLFVFHHMQGLIAAYANRLSENARKRCDARSRTYLFFLLVRLMQYPHAGGLIGQTVATLKSDGVYPVPQPYAGWRFAVSAYVVNHPCLLRLANRLWTLIHKS